MADTTAAQMGAPANDLDTPALLRRMRDLEDRALRLETTASSLDGRHTDLRSEMRAEIKSIRNEIAGLGRKMDETNAKVKSVDAKLDRLFNTKSVVTGIITLITSILGTGLVHVVLSIGQ